MCLEVDNFHRCMDQALFGTVTRLSKFESQEKAAHVLTLSSPSPNFGNIYKPNRQVLKNYGRSKHVCSIWTRGWFLVGFVNLASFKQLLNFKHICLNRYECTHIEFRYVVGQFWLQVAQLYNSCQWALLGRI